MRKVTAILVLILVGVSVAARADDTLKEGRSVGGPCSNAVLVCAFLKDGTMRPTSECGARQEATVRVLPGDCYDED